MSIDTTLLGTLTASVMDSIADQYGDDFTVRTVALVVEVDSPKTGQLVVRCSDDRPWVLNALLGEAMDSIAAARAEMVERSKEDGDES